MLILTRFQVLGEEQKILLLYCIEVNILEEMVWESLLYFEEEFHALCELSKTFNDDINKNHRIRKEGESFSEFIDAGSSALINENLSIVQRLI